MNNGIKMIFAFTLGAAAGVVVAQRYFKTKYETIAQEEIDSVKEVYYKKRKNEIEKTVDNICNNKPNDNLGELDAYKDTVHDLGYDKKEGGSEAMTDNMIEVIPPDEFGAYDDYDLIGLTYYANDVLTDDGDFPIDDPEEVVGPDALDSFGEWEDDTVYVRNDTLKCYYEICRDNSEYDYSDQSVDDK